MSFVALLSIFRLLSQGRVACQNSTLTGVPHSGTIKWGTWPLLPCSPKHPVNINLRRLKNKLTALAKTVILKSIFGIALALFHRL